VEKYYTGRFSFYVCFLLLVLFSINSLIAMAVPDVPPEVEIQLDRQEYLRGKILDNIEVSVGQCMG
jgi:hypothetical protein